MCSLARCRRPARETSNVWLGLFEATDGKRLFFRQATFCGDNDDAWRHAATFLSREILAYAPAGQ